MKCIVKYLSCHVLHSINLYNQYAASETNHERVFIKGSFELAVTIVVFGGGSISFCPVPPSYSLYSQVARHAYRQHRHTDEQLDICTEVVAVGVGYCIACRLPQPVVSESETQLICKQTAVQSVGLSLYDGVPQSPDRSSHVKVGHLIT